MSFSVLVKRLKFYHYAEKVTKQLCLCVGSIKILYVSISSLHQLHVIDPKWVEDVQNRAFRDRLADAVVAADKLIAGRVNSNVYQEYKTLVEIHKDPWTGSAILPIISGTPDYKSIGK